MTMSKPGRIALDLARRSFLLRLILSLLVFFTPLAGILPSAQAQTPTQGLVSFPNPEVEFIVGPQLPAGGATFFDQNEITKGLQHGANFPATPPAFKPGGYALDGTAQSTYQNQNYYDLALTMYVAYFRTNDIRFRDYARKVADSWWLSAGIDEGRVTDFDTYSYAPRGISLLGLMLRALDGRPEMWRWITEYTRHMFQGWVGARVTYDGLYYGARDGGYMLLYAASLARVHPDATVRNEFYDKSLNAAVNYYARLQYPDGSFRWDDGEGGIYWQGKATQPFHVGLLLEGMVAVHRLTNNETVKASILKACESLSQPTSYRSVGWRAFYYLANTTPAPVPEPWPNTSGDPNTVREARSLNSTSIHAFGYAYAISGDAKFKTFGDELFDSTYSKADGYYGLADFREKEYNQSYRTGGKYLAWRLGSGALTPSPTSSPTPTPTSSPTPTPTPTPTPSPINNGLTVSLTSPTAGQSFVSTTSITVGANATSTDSTINNVKFYAGTALIGTAITAPYNITWGNMAAGSYTLTAFATDNKGVAKTSSAISITIKKSPGSVRGAKRNAQALADQVASSSSASSAEGESGDAQATSINGQLHGQLHSLTGQIEEAYSDFFEERYTFSSQDNLGRQLFSALYLARASTALAKKQTPVAGVQDRLRKIVSYLSMAEDLMLSGKISDATAESARLANARSEISFGRADTRPASDQGQLLTPAAAGVIAGASDRNPLTTQTAVATPDAKGDFPYELAGVAVTIGGHAATLLSVSPMQIMFKVPADLAGGFAEVLVTSRDGAISYWAANVTGINPLIFNVIGGDKTAGAIFDSVNSMTGDFRVTTRDYFTADQRTRLMIYSTGISSGVTNTDPSNDVSTEKGVLTNLAEGVRVEALAKNGAIFSLPVEYAGAQGQVPGVDQVNVVLPSDLAGTAGDFTLTIIVNGQRSNSINLIIR